MYQRIFIVAVLLAAGFLLAQGASVFATSGSCTSALIALLGDGCHSMYNDSAGNQVYCNGAMTVSAKAGDTTATQGCSGSTAGTSGGASYSNCSAALTALLGTGCHYMYNDASGKATYCNGAMTLSAKEGDTAVTQGCSSNTSSGTTTATVASSCTGALTALLGDGCHYMYNDSAGNQMYCNAAMTVSAKAGDTTATQGCGYSGTTSTAGGVTSTTNSAPIISNVSIIDIHDTSATITWNTDKLTTSKVEYWIGNAYGAFKEDAAYATYHAIHLDGLQPGTTYSFNALSRDANYYTGYAYNRTFATTGSSQTTVATTTVTTVVTTATTATTTATTGGSCPSGYHYMSFSAGGSTAYCMNDTDGNVCQPLGGGATYACPGLAATQTIATTTPPIGSPSCPAGYHYMYPYTSESSGYCMNDTNSSVCQPTGSGAVYACPGFSSQGTTATTTASTTATANCDAVLAALLGSGCHPMYQDAVGNQVYCNGAMTQSAKKGDAAITQGCSYSGGTGYATTTATTAGACDAVLATLLGAGCHYMFNDSAGNPVYCNGAMTASAKKGDTAAAAECSSAGGTNVFGVTWVNSGTDADGKIRVTVSFSRSVEQATLTDAAIGLFRIADGLRVNGKISAYASGFEYLTFEAPQAGFTYEMRIKKVVRDTVGNTFPLDYVSSPFSVAGGAQKSFSVDPSRTHPTPNASDIDTASRIRVGFTKPLASDSLKTEFFSLVNMTYSASPLAGTFSIISDAFEFIPAAPLEPNAKYLYTVFTTVKDDSGIALSASFTASFSTAASTTVRGGEVFGSVADSAGNPVSRAFVYFSKSDYAFSRQVETDARGEFSAFLPEGSYRIEVFPPLGRGDLIKPDVVSVSLFAGAREKLLFRFGAAVKTITGLVLFSGGNPVLDAEVGAYSSESGAHVRGAVDGKGRYALKVDSGAWEVGIRPNSPAAASWSYAGPFPKILFARDTIAETQIVDFTVPVADGKLLVKAIDQSGSAVAGAGVIVDTVGSAQASAEIRFPPQFKQSDASGAASFSVRGGSYYARGSLPPESGFLNPEEQFISVYSGETRTVTLVFRKRDKVSAATLSGIVKLGDGAPTDAFVWAWSEKGGFADTRSDDTGVFRMHVASSQRWHIGAGKEIAGVPYKAPEITVDVAADGSSIELFLTKFREIPLPPTVSVRQSATEHAVAQAQDGAKISIPPAAATGSGTVQVEVKPTIEAPSQAAAKVVSTVYEVTVRDAAGTEITQLKENAEIVLPYSEEELKKQGVTEESIVPSFFDEKTAAWVKIDNYTVDKEKNVIIARVKHLTRFAIVAAADITPPAAPTNISASALGNGKISVVWANPTRDFSHAKVYKSERIGTFGEILSAETRGTSVTDGAVRDGVTYYYTVRAVDPAGNESNNTDRVIARAVGTSPALLAGEPKPLSVSAATPSKSALARNLRKGNSGDDVKTLQSLLLKEGVYPQGLITGYFGARTKQAVILFQEKYAAEILMPVGLTKGNGFVGSATRTKINALFGK